MKICFYVRISDPKVLEIIGFYKQDIVALRKIDPSMKIATKIWEIDWKADVIFVWWWTYAFIPVLFGLLLKKAVFVTGTFNYRCPESPIDYFRRPFYQRVLIKFSIRNAKLNILVSKNEFDTIKTEWKLKNLAYSPHGVDIEKYKYSDKREDFLLFTICWTGKYNLRRKCLPELISAIDRIRNKVPQVKLYVGGRKGDGFEEVKNMIIDRKLNDSIILLGEISEEEKISYYQKCTIYLQPSKYEGFGLAIAEAMSCGAAVITSRVGEVEYLVGDCGILIDGCEINDIADSVIGLMLHKVKNKNYGYKAAQRIRDVFPIERREKELFELIKDNV